MQDNQSREAGSTGLHLCGLYYYLSNPNQPEVEFLHSWAVVMAKFLSGKNKNT